MVLVELIERFRHRPERTPEVRETTGQLKFVEIDDLLLEVEEDGRRESRFVYVDPEVADSFVRLLRTAKIDPRQGKVMVKVAERAAEFPGRIEVVVSETDRGVVSSLENVLNGNTTTNFIGLSQSTS